MESSLVPYSACDYLPAQSVLVVAPHPDDEAFGCGGAILSHVSKGESVRVVVLTDGSGAGEAQTRYSESRAAGQLLGYGEPEFWGLPDRSLWYNDALVHKLSEALNTLACDLVYAPSPWEIHPDHRQAALLAIEAVRRCRFDVRIAFYEIGGPLRPNLLLNISRQVGTKAAAMRCFSSQLERQDYLGHIQALNRYRTYTLPSEIEAAEAYCVLDRNALEQCIREGAFGTPALQDFQPAAEWSQARTPLVSVLIRSMDRPELAQALDSVALQTYPHAEVVVVAAGGSHQALPDFCGAYPLRLIANAEQLPRSKAANTALLEAKGAYCIFLDDDDWLMPGHLSRLVDVLERQPQTNAAYTGVSLVDVDGNAVGQAFDLPFDDVRLLAGNLTPIHAVMFRASLVQSGCRFDEALDKYEDWDFWLQIAQQGAMAHLPGVSAVYRIHTSSGIHEDSGPLGAATQLIYQKWNLLWTPQQWGQIMRRVWGYSELEMQWQEAQGIANKTRMDLDECRLSLEKQVELASQQSIHIGQLSGALNDQAMQLKLQSATIGDLRLMLDQNSEVLREQLHVIGKHIAFIATQTSSLEREHARWLFAQEELQLIRHSASWQLTRPLRWLAERVRRLLGKA